MALFRKLTFVSLGATIVLVAIGGLVRATKSGLGCGTDWPDCGGKLVPSLATRAEVVEFSHRLTAMVVGLLIAWLAVVAPRRVADRRIKRTSLAALGLVIFQALLGAAVVKAELERLVVVAHLVAAMSLLALLVYLAGMVTARATGLDGATDASLSRRVMWGAAGILALLVVGSLASTRDIGGSWPLVDGKLVPDLGVETYALHWLHRVLAGVVGIIVFTVAARVIRRKREMPVAARFAHAAAGLFGVEILVGAANLWTDQNSVVVALHLTVAALIWASFAAMATLTHPSVRTAPAPAVGRVPAVAPAAGSAGALAEKSGS
ncbi:MAG: COX15/CtaA family protein [Actinomycetota bacterium]|nr:COX15/CtaA family protein [Actinomycetota bacterium]